MAETTNPNFRQGGAQEYYKPAPKRIIICCDGTWQSSVTNATNVPSNVTRIARYLCKTDKDEHGQEWQQLVYYDAGIGTGVSKAEAARQGGTGSGFVGNVIEAYNFIVLNYNEGDKIYCFGFSRGAYTARAVAGLVTDIGVIGPRDMQDFPELYRLYQAHTDSHSFRKSKAWRKWCSGELAPESKKKDLPYGWFKSPFAWESKPHAPAPESTRWVEAIGVFDTVGALGIPEIEGVTGWFVNLGKGLVPIDDFGFHNVALSPFIKHAYHAMALDERRKPFNTTLWHFPADGVATSIKPKAPADELRNKWYELKDKEGVTEQELSDAWSDLITAEMYDELKGHDSELIQVWFPGFHINIGGGSDDLLKKKQGDFEQMSLITLNWMLDAGLKNLLGFPINVTDIAQMDRFALMRPVIEDLLDTPYKKGKRDPTHWILDKVDPLVAKAEKTGNDNQDKWTARNIAADVLNDWGTGVLLDTFEDMKQAGEQYRTPGEYKETKLQNGKVVKLGKTNEYIHPVVKYRMEQVGYSPVSLKNFARRKKTEGQTVSYEWVKGDVRIPEYKIGKNNWSERQCVQGDKARQYLENLDKEYGINVWE